MPSFERLDRRALRTNIDLQLWKGAGSDIIRPGSGGGSAHAGSVLVMQPTNWKWPPAVALTLATDAVTLTQSHHTIDTEAAAASDNLATVNGLVANEFYLLRPANDGRTIVVKNGTGNIDCIGGADFTLDDIEDFILGFSPDGVRMYAMFGAGGGGGGGGAHDHTSGDGSGVLTNDEHDGYGEYAEIAAPSTPAAAKVRVYPKSDGLMYVKDDAGVEREMGTVAHLADAVDAHVGTAIGNTPAGSIAATTVQAAINELDGDVTAHLADATDAHDASAVSNVPAGSVAATDVQTAINELATDYAAADAAHAAAGDPHPAYALDSDLTAHLTDAVAAHAASAISVADTAGEFAGIDVEDVLAELRNRAYYWFWEGT